jgi:chorismate mutase
VSTADDPVLRDLREQVSALDRAIVEAINSRLELVARIKRHKDEHGLSFVDAAREEAIREELGRGNRGPLSTEGLRELVDEVLALTKRELGRAEEAG